MFDDQLCASSMEGKSFSGDEAKEAFVRMRKPHRKAIGTLYQHLSRTRAVRICKMRTAYLSAIVHDAGISDGNCRPELSTLIFRSTISCFRTRIAVPLGPDHQQLVRTA